MWQSLGGPECVCIYIYIYTYIYIYMYASFVYGCRLFCLGLLAWVYLLAASRECRSSVAYTFITY